jgi:hypothetical protein
VYCLEGVFVNVVCVCFDCSCLLVSYSSFIVCWWCVLSGGLYVYTVNVVGAC